MQIIPAATLNTDIVQPVAARLESRYLSRDSSGTSFESVLAGAGGYKPTALEPAAEGEGEQGLFTVKKQGSKPELNYSAVFSALAFRPDVTDQVPQVSDDSAAADLLDDRQILMESAQVIQSITDILEGKTTEGNMDDLLQELASLLEQLEVPLEDNEFAQQLMARMPQIDPPQQTLQAPQTGVQDESAPCPLENDSEITRPPAGAEYAVNPGRPAEERATVSPSIRDFTNLYNEIRARLERGDLQITGIEAGETEREPDPFLALPRGESKDTAVWAPAENRQTDPTVLTSNPEIPAQTELTPQQTAQTAPEQGEQTKQIEQTSLNAAPEQALETRQTAPPVSEPSEQAAPLQADEQVIAPQTERSERQAPPSQPSAGAQTDQAVQSASAEPQIEQTPERPQTPLPIEPSQDLPDERPAPQKLGAGEQKLPEPAQMIAPSAHSGQSEQASPEPGGQPGGEGESERQASAVEQPAVNLSAPFDIAPMRAEAGLTANAPAPVQTVQATPQTLFDTMVEQIAVDTQSVEIELRPEHLGKVSIELSLDAHGLQAKIRADDPGVKSIIGGQINQLIESLNQKGVRVNEVDVVYTGPQMENFEQGGGQTPSGNSRRNRALARSRALKGIESSFELPQSADTSLPDSATVQYKA